MEVCRGLHAKGKSRSFVWHARVLYCAVRELAARLNGTAARSGECVELIPLFGLCLMNEPCSGRVIECALFSYFRPRSLSRCLPPRWLMKRTKIAQRTRRMCEIEFIRRRTLLLMLCSVSLASDRSLVFILLSRFLHAPGPNRLIRSHRSRILAKTSPSRPAFLLFTPTICDSQLV